MLSVLDAVYDVTAAYQRHLLDEDATEPVPESVRQELRMLLKLAPFVRADLDFETASHVLMRDACPLGDGSRVLCGHARCKSEGAHSHGWQLGACNRAAEPWVLQSGPLAGFCPHRVEA